VTVTVTVAVAVASASAWAAFAVRSGAHDARSMGPLCSGNVT